MENTIRILSIFSQSGPLAFMFLVLGGVVVAIYVASHIFQGIKRADARAFEELRKTNAELQFRLNKQVEHRPSE